MLILAIIIVIFSCTKLISMSTNNFSTSSRWPSDQHLIPSTTRVARNIASIINVYIKLILRFAELTLILTWGRKSVRNPIILEFWIHPHTTWSVLSCSVWLYFQWMLRWINIKAMFTCKTTGTFLDRNSEAWDDSLNDMFAMIVTEIRKQLKQKKPIGLKKYLLAQTHKRRQIKLQNFLSMHFYKCRSHIL